LLAVALVASLGIWPGVSSSGASPEVSAYKVPPNGQLRSVSCPAVNDCVAVGYYEAHIDDFYYSMRTLVETWNGTVWSVSKTPNQSPRDNELLGVSCTSVNACTAVGGWEPVAGPASEPSLRPGTARAGMWPPVRTARVGTSG
jgi:hypothetical protein